MDIHIMVNWQLSKKAICWPVSHDCIAGSWTLFTAPTPPPSKKKLRNHCFQFLLGITVIPSEIENNGYVKFWEGKQGVLWSMWQWWIEWMNGDVFCKVIHGPVVGFQLIVGSVPKFPFVKETVSCMWFRWHRQVHFASVITTLNDLLSADVENHFLCFWLYSFEE